MSQPERSRQVLAEGLSSQQLRLMLGALVNNRLVNCIGTPSREEIPKFEEPDGSTSRALGGFIMAGMEDIFVDTTISYLEESGDNNSNQRFDLAVLTQPMGENDLGVETAVVAQVYPADLATEPVSDTAINAWLEQYQVQT